MRSPTRRESNVTPDKQSEGLLFVSKHFLDWIERRGQELRCRLSLEPTAALNPYKLAQTMEVRVVSPLDILELAPCLLDQLLVQDSDSWSGGTLLLPNGKTIVVLNPNHSETRKRATLMEELAHVFLGHTPSSLIVFKNRTAMRSCKKSQETQAYGVGAAALVPMKLLQHAQSNLTAREKLAHYCGVSVDLVTFREKVTGVKLG
ncbi:ImmA/IrrE family metallo-endopeptidase [Microcoleus sp. D3_18a_C4]